LTRMDTISTVSGGSLLSGFLASRFPDWPEHGPLRDWHERIVEPVLEFTKINIRTPAVLESLAPGRFPPLSTAVDSLERRYREHIADLALEDLAPPRPRFVWCATDMAYGVNWQSEHGFVGDYRAGYRKPPGWPVARAIAASSDFPPVFQPLPIGIPPGDLRWWREDRETRAKHDECVSDLRLSDGGVYDNMGLEPVWKSHKLVLVSDGGATFDPRPDSGLVKRLGRYTQIVQNQASAVRKRWLIAGFIDGELEGTYWGIGTAPSSYNPELVVYDRQLVDDYISEMRTDLDCFQKGEQRVLINHGYLLADAAIAKHADSLPTERPALRVPYEDWLDPARVRAALKDSSKRTRLGRWRQR
jgi:NTE family protein